MGDSMSKVAMKFGKMVRKQKLMPPQMTERFTQTSDLFVLAHMGIPAVSADDWSLQIDGLVETPLNLTFEDLQKLPKREIVTIHQCAGSPLNPTAPTRRIANVRWAGVDLRELLSEVGIKPGATHLWAYGLDHGEFAGEAQEAYLKDSPLSRLDGGDVLIAYELNGEPLPVEHGFPARLLVPGYFGTNSVKWLSRLNLADHRATSLFTSRFYNDDVPGSDDTRPVWEIAPESVFVSPAPDAQLTRGPQEIWGWAWSASAVQSVEVSTDGGVTWNEAELEPRVQRTWQKFSFSWTDGKSGAHELLCRATDSAGNTQPLTGARNAVYGVTVTVN